MGQGDSKLIDRIRKGDQSAFAQLVEEHQGAIYSLCYRMTGNQGDAEDLTQETFLRFYSSINRFRNDSPLRPWLHRIASNATLDFLRQRRIPTITLEDSIEAGSLPDVSNNAAPDEMYLTRETKEAVQEVLLRIPADFRIVLVLRFLQEMSYREISEVLGVPTSTIETRLFRGKKALAMLLRAHLEAKEGVSHELPLGR